MSREKIVWMKMGLDGKFQSALDEVRAEAGSMLAFAAPATSETVYTMPANSTLHVRSVIIYNGEAGQRSVRLNDSADAQVFPIIFVAGTDNMILGPDDLSGLTFTDDVKAQTDAGAIAVGIQIWVGGVLESTAAHAAE